MLYMCVLSLSHSLSINIEGVNMGVQLAGDRSLKAELIVCNILGWGSLIDPKVFGETLISASPSAATAAAHRPPAIAAGTTVDHLLSSLLPLSFSWEVGPGCC
nr:hypothetical protein [Tanacetum cinerariifolium]